MGDEKIRREREGFVIEARDVVYKVIGIVLKSKNNMFFTFRNDLLSLFFILMKGKLSD